jgi:lactate 2-monooxygenase
MSSIMKKELPQNEHETAELRQWGAYQTEIYAAGLVQSRLPIVTTDPNKLEEQARESLAPGPYNYVAGGAGEKATMDANRLAFRQWKMIPRMLKSTTARDVRTELFGETYGIFPNV